VSTGSGVEHGPQYFDWQRAGVANNTATGFTFADRRVTGRATGTSGHVQMGSTYRGKFAVVGRRADAAQLCDGSAPCLT
jgi:hypothetical protein